MEGWRRAVVATGGILRSSVEDAESVNDELRKFMVKCLLEALE
jgi:hypothetical protein